MHLLGCIIFSSFTVHTRAADTCMVGALHLPVDLESKQEPYSLVGKPCLLGASSLALC